MSDNLISLGEYIVIQRQNYMKLHKLNKPNSTVTLGRDVIELQGVVGSENFSIFKMVAKGNKKNRVHSLEAVKETKDLKESIDIVGSGTDNRNILDDGRSQKLSAAEIEELKNDSTSSSDIVGTLISNSKTFHSKTEFSQEKYLKKKEKKYFEYLQIRRPNLRLISEILYRLDPGKIQGIRMDTLSQIITFSNISGEGTHLLYDSGSNGLMTAALLNVIGANTSGRLIHLHPGNMSQKQALLAANFPQEQLQRCVSANVYSALRQYYQGCDTHDKSGQPEPTAEHDSSRKRSHENGQDEIESKIAKLDKESADTPGDNVEKSESEVVEPAETNNTESKEQSQNLQEVNTTEKKKPKWHFDTIAAAEALANGVDCLIITCKEDPQNIFNELARFVKPSRAFVIYYPVAEPLQQCYMTLKSRADVGALKLTSNWMRNYQVLSERTHPEVMMNNCSGFLLSGYTLK